MGTRLFSWLVSMILAAQLALGPLGAQGTPEDDKIYDEVRAKLANDREVKGGGLVVIVKQGVVTIRGNVQTEKARQKATAITRKVKGVVNVDNQLRLLGAS
jgi:osmotically-inducible protein OsmY